jgi:hypothetical protein
MEPTLKDHRRAQAEREIAAVNEALAAGHPPVVLNNKYEKSAVRVASEKLGVPRQSFHHRIGSPNAPGMWHRLFKLQPGWDIYKEKIEAIPAVEPSPFATEYAPPPAYTGGHAIELTIFMLVQNTRDGMSVTIFTGGSLNLGRNATLIPAIGSMEKPTSIDTISRLMD